MKIRQNLLQTPVGVKRSILIFSVLLMTLCVNSASAQSANDLSGTWTLDFDATLSLMDTVRLGEYNSLAIDVQNEIRSNMVGAQYIFGADSVFTTYTTQNDTILASWELVATDLMVDYESGVEMTYPIETLTENVLVIVVDTNSQSAAMFHRFSLIKTN